MDSIPENFLQIITWWKCVSGRFMTFRCRSALGSKGSRAGSEEGELDETS